MNLTQQQIELMNQYRGKREKLERDLGDEGLTLLYYHPEVKQSVTLACQFLGYASSSLSNFSHKWKRIGLQVRRVAPIPEKSYTIDKQDTPMGQTANNLLNLLQKNRGVTLDILASCDNLDCSPKTVKMAVDELLSFGYEIDDEHLSVHLPEYVPDAIHYKKMDWPQTEFKIGFIADTHLGGKDSDERIMNIVYDRYEDLGITQVLHAGDITDGAGERGYRGHGREVWNSCYSADGLIEYTIDKYPKRNGITTSFIRGNHDDWEFEKTGRNIFIEICNSRPDMICLGNTEVDITIGPKNNTRVKIFHPGGGSAYSSSYKLQKKIESIVGGDKPHLILMGHFHKALYLFQRNIHSIMGGCTQWTSLFMKRHMIEPTVGAWIIRLVVEDDGWIREIEPSFMAFYKE
jgi:hypothetical protein